MKSIIHKLCDEMMQALGPILHTYGDDWENIRVATCLVMARVIQATPHKGLEQSILTQTQEDIANALTQFLQLEEQAVNARAAEKDRTRSLIEGGIAGFGNLTVVNGSEPGPSLVGEPAIVETERPSQEDIHDVQSAIEEAAMESGAEVDQAEKDEDGYNPDGPRSYAP